MSSRTVHQESALAQPKERWYLSEKILDLFNAIGKILDVSFVHGSIKWQDPRYRTTLSPREKAEIDAMLLGLSR
jgi:hypothetical protein